MSTPNNSTNGTRHDMNKQHGSSNAGTISPISSTISTITHPSGTLPVITPTSTSTTASAATTIASTTFTTSNTIPAPVVSHATVDALGDLLEFATVNALPAAQEQRRKQSYKSGSLVNKTMKQSQEERRRQALAEQAKKRYQFTNHARKLALFSSGQPLDDSDSEDNEERDDDEDDDEEEEDEDENTAAAKKKRTSGTTTPPSLDLTAAGPGNEITSLVKHKRRLSSGSESESALGKKKDPADALSPKKPRLQKASPKAGNKKKKKDRNPFRDQLMMPETMMDIPPDLDSSYYIVPLPIGHRCFVISADGKTTARLPSGQLLVSAFESCLPAGSSSYRGNRRSDYCILDCVYSSVTRTFWTLDIMCWRGHPVYECETEFRFWWLRGKLAEIEELQGKWISSQVRQWEQEEVKRRQKKAKQAQRRQDKLLASRSISGAMEISPNPGTGGPSGLRTSRRYQEEMEDASVDGEGGAEMGEEDGGMEVEENPVEASKRRFWPIVFTPLPYFNASINLVRLLAESMYHPPPQAPAAAGGSLAGAVPRTLDPSSTAITNLLSLTTLSGPAITASAAVKRSQPAMTLALAATPATPTTTSRPLNPVSRAPSSPPSPLSPSASFSASSTCISATPGPTFSSSSSSSSSSSPPSSSPSSSSAAFLGTMALSGEIADAASLFPAHDKTQKTRQDQTLLREQAAGLVFFNKKTMYVLGTTPLCGWVAMDRVGDVFFGEEGGVGPVPGTKAVEGREVEMEDALERIRIR